MGFSKVDSKTQKWSQRSEIGLKMRVVWQILQFRGFFYRFFLGLALKRG